MKVAFLTLGCKVNSYETSKMKTAFEDAGYTVTSFEDYADIYIVNTCTVTNIADRKSRKMLHKARRMNPEAVVVAAGCYVDSAARRGETDDSVDIFISNKDKPDIIGIVSNAVKNRIAVSEEKICQTEKQQEHTRAYVKVQDGCSQYCTYCIIPYVRGKVRSRDIGEVEAEVKELAQKGYKEVVITGIHVSSYGTDPDDAKSFTRLGGRPLVKLLNAVNSVAGIERIRLGSLEPRIITEGFVKELAAMPKLCPHFHLSLQSGCDTVLKRMNRHYTAREYLRCVEILRKYFDQPAITTDIITGFPQETEEEFKETCQFAYKAGFAQIHVFKYSRRHGTIADKMDGQLEEQVKADRSQRLISIGKELETAYQKHFLKKYEKVLFEEITEIDNRKYLAGYNERYIRIAVPADKINNADSLCNTIKKVCISGNLTDEILIGEIL